MTTTPFKVDTGRLHVPVSDDDHALGPGRAPVTLVEYGDYQCPYCGQAHPILGQLMAERPETVKLVFRNFPLIEAHPHAEIAAEFAEAAAVRGLFWPAHDWLFTHQDRLAPTQLEATAKDFDPSGGIVKELATHNHMDRIRRDFIGGIRSGVNGTPTFYVNGLRHDGGYSLGELLRVVDAAAADS